MKSMASSRLLTVTRGRMGPKISSCITGSVSCTSTNTVGATDTGSRQPLHRKDTLSNRDSDGTESGLQDGESQGLTSEDCRLSVYDTGLMEYGTVEDRSGI